MAGECIAEAEVVQSNQFINATNSDAASYESLELWSIQLYNWVAYEPNKLNQFKEELKTRFLENLEHFSKLVDGGEFVDNYIDITGKPIRFPNLRFKWETNSQDRREFICEIRIRINPCEKEAWISEVLDSEISSEVDTELILNKLKLHGLFKIALRKVRNNAWSFVDNDTEFLVLLQGNKIQVFNRDLSPFSSKIIVIVKPTEAYRFNEDEKQLFFQFADSKADQIIEEIGKLYLPEHHASRPMPRIIIKSAATCNEALLDLVDRNKQGSLAFAIKKDNYINNIMDGMMSTLYGVQVKNWISRNWSEETEKRIVRTAWKFIESNDVKGLYATVRNEEATTICSLFFFNGKNYSDVYGIIRAWVDDLIGRL